MYDLLIVNGSVVSPTGTEALDVAVNGETIVAVGPSRARSGQRRRKVIDAAGCLVIPGGDRPARALRDELRAHPRHRGPAVLVRRGARRQHDA